MHIWELLLSEGRARHGISGGFARYVARMAWKTMTGRYETGSGCVLEIKTLCACFPDPVRADSSIHWSAYPALFLAGSLSVGIVFVAAGGLSSVWAWLAVTGIGGALWAGAWWDDRRRLVSLASLCRIASIVLLAVATGALRMILFSNQPPDRLHHQADSIIAAGDTTTIAGVIADAPTGSAESVRFTLAVRTWSDEGTEQRATGKVRVTLRSSPWDDAPAPFPKVFQGDRVRLHGSLRAPPAPRNPADFDYGAYLRHRGIYSTLYVSDAADIRILQRRTGRVQRVVTRARSRIRRSVHAHVPSDTSQAILQALLIGDRSQVEGSHKDAFARTGLMHLLAVSGLHVLLVGMVLYTLLRPFLHRFRLRWQTVEHLRAASTISVLLLYMLLTGSPPSVVRAVVMAVLLIGSILFQRTTHTLNTLGVAAVVLLMLRPTALFDAGFQLSMSAVTGIVVLNPRLEDACRRVLPEPIHQSEAGAWLISMTTVSTAATLGTAPVLLHHFGFVALGGLALNIVAIPLTAVGLTAGLLTLFAAPVFTPGAAAFGAAADASVRVLTETAVFGATWMGGGVHLSNPSGWTLASIAAAVAVIAQFPRPKHRWRLIIAASFLATAGFVHDLVQGESSPTLEVLFLDVGQGDAVLVSTPDGRHMLVDAGPRSPFSDAGESVVVPHLKHAGIDKLDVLVATHPDSDHLGGVPSVMKSLEVGRFIHSGRSSDSELFAESRRILQKNAIPSTSVISGDSISLGQHVSVDVLGPPAKNASGSWEENDASVVLMISFGKTRILLPGDVEQAGERWLVSQFGDELASDLVKAAHHGSSTSSSPVFVKATTSDPSRRPVVVIPVGRFNQFGMPVPDVMTRWQSRTGSLFRTDVHGALGVSSDGHQILVRSFMSPSDTTQARTLF